LRLRIGSDRPSVTYERTAVSQDPAGQAERAAPDPAAAAPHAAALADVMALQTTIGNRALARAIQTGRVGAAPPLRPGTRVLARAVGLRVGTRVDELADDALTWWRDPANKDKPLDDYAKHLVTKVNQMLKTLGSYEVKDVIDPAGSNDGQFSRVSWEIQINPTKFSARANVTKVGELTADEAAEIADTIYHECRHSEQYFRIARAQAARLVKDGDADPATTIEAGMSIPHEVAEAAVKAPLKATATNTDILAEIEGWESITVGRHGEYKGNINTWKTEADTLDDEIKAVTAANVTAVKKKVDSTLGDWKKDADHIKFVKAHLADTQALTTKTEMDKRVVTHLTAIQTKFDAFNTAAKAALKGWLTANSAKRLTRIQGLKDSSTALYKALYDAYRAHIHEEDAWATGGAVGKRFRTEQATRVAAEKAAAETAAKQKLEEAAKKKAEEAAKKKAAAKKKKKAATPKKKTAATPTQDAPVTADAAPTPASDGTAPALVADTPPPAVPAVVAVTDPDEELEDENEPVEVTA
jgi:hypothetical protein